MEIRQRLSEVQKETATVAFDQKELTWEGVGARVKISQGENADVVQAFILDRTDNPLDAFDVTSPLVLRVVGSDGTSEVADDYVMYSDDESANEGAALFRSPKVIDDIGDHLRGEWPIPHAFVNENGVKALRSLIEVVMTEDSSKQVEFENGDSKVFTNLGAVSLRAVGTAPIQPVRNNEVSR